MRYSVIFKRQSFIIVVSIIGISLILLGASYALFMSNHQGSDQTLSAGTLSATFSGSTVLSTDLVPLTDEEALASETNVYTFSLNNTGSLAMEYKLTLANSLDGVNDNNMIAHKYVKVKFDDESPVYLDKLMKLDDSKTNENEVVYVLRTGVINSGVSNEAHTIRIWISDVDSSGAETDESIIGKTIAFKIGLEGKATDPVVFASEYIEGLLASNPETMNNDDPDGNVRYMGADPNNYVSFNNELWRIIGVFDVKSSEEGQKEKRLKIIRNKHVAWDYWDDNLVNDWSKASLKSYLNGEYLDSIESKFRSFIGDTYWNLGSAYYDSTASLFYSDERGTSAYDGHATHWVGKIGLMYPSDYGYATSGGKTMSRELCLAKELNKWNESTYNECYQNDYLSFNYINDLIWTITSDVNNSTGILSVANGWVSSAGYDLGYSAEIVPVVYLKSTIIITNGDGTKSNPYEISL